MSHALNLDKAPSWIKPKKVHAPSSRVTEVVATQTPATSPDDATTRNHEPTSTTSKTQSSKTAVSNSPTIPSLTVFPFFRLPRELRDEIYIYASLTKKTWIGRPPRASDGFDEAIVENPSIYKPATLIRTSHSIVGVCHETRDEFRTAMWREYMTTRQTVHFQVYDFAPGPLEELFAACSAAEARKLRRKQKSRVHHQITSTFHKHRHSKHAYCDIVKVLDAWLLFKVRKRLFAKQTIYRCEWYDARLLRATMLEDGSTRIPAWEIRWESPIFLELWEAVSEAYEKRSVARNARRNAFHKLAPLGQ